MLKTRIIKSGFKTAWTHKLRAIFMILGVTVGIAALTIIISIGKGTEQKIMTKVKMFFSSNTIMVVAGGGQMEQNKRYTTTIANLKVDDIQEISERLENVIGWDAVQELPDKEANYNGMNTLVSIAGQMPYAETMWNLRTTEGRFFSDAENQSLARIAVIGPNVKRELFGNSEAIRQQIKIDNIPFQVIGILPPRGIDPHGVDKDSEIIIPLNTLLRRVANIDYIMMGKFTVADDNSIVATAEQVREILRARHSISSNEDDDFIVITPLMVNEMIKEATKVFNLYLPIVAIVSLLVGSIVVANLMLISINERVKEIGLRKAVGAKSKDILSQFLIEASSITIFSGIIGIGVGIGLLTQVVRFMDLPFLISVPALVGSLIISCLIGIAAGYFPARKASQMDPVNLLK